MAPGTPHDLDALLAEAQARGLPRLHPLRHAQLTAMARRSAGCADGVKARLWASARALLDGALLDGTLLDGAPLDSALLSGALASPPGGRPTLAPDALLASPPHGALAWSPRGGLASSPQAALATSPQGAEVGKALSPRHAPTGTGTGMATDTGTDTGTDTDTDTDTDSESDRIKQAAAPVSKPSTGARAWGMPPPGPVAAPFVPPALASPSPLRALLDHLAQRSATVGEPLPTAAPSAATGAHAPLSDAEAMGASAALRAAAAAAEHLADKAADKAAEPAAPQANAPPNQRSAPVAAQPAALQAAPVGELKALRLFRPTWARLSTELRMQQALTPLPSGAGPLNSQRLVHRSLALMRSVSPDYLAQFVSYVDALRWLDELQDASGARATASASQASGGEGRGTAPGRPGARGDGRRVKDEEPVQDRGGVTRAKGMKRARGEGRERREG